MCSCGRCYKTAFQSTAEHPQTRYTDRLFCSCDLDFDLDPMTLIQEFDLDILRYLQAKKELSRSKLSKVRALQRERKQMRLQTLQRRSPVVGGKKYRRHSRYVIYYLRGRPGQHISRLRLDRRSRITLENLRQLGWYIDTDNRSAAEQQTSCARVCRDVFKLCIYEISLTVNQPQFYAISYNKIIYC